MSKKRFIMKRFLVSPSQAAPFDAKRALADLCTSLDVPNRVVSVGAEEIALHASNNTRRIFTGQASVFQRGKVQEALRLIPGQMDVPADIIGPPARGGQWIDSSVFFAVTGNLMALATARGISDADLERMFTELLGPNGTNELLPDQKVLLPNARSLAVVDRVEGASKVEVVAMIDEQAIERVRPSRGDAYMLDQFGSLTRDVILRAAGGPIDLQGKRIKMKVTFSVEGGLRGVESAVLDQIANVLHGADELKSTISLGRSGTLQGSELRVETWQDVPQTAGDATLVELGGRLSEWLLEASRDHDVPHTE